MTEFRLLGPVEVHATGRVLDIGPARQQGVLAALLYDANRPVSVDHLVERVWGDRRLPERPRNAVYTYVSLLNRALAGAAAVIVRRTHGYMIELDDEQLDLHRFRTLIEKARCARGGAVALFEQAFALWRGEALPVLDTPWAQSTRRALEVERIAAESELMDVQLSLGRHATLLAALVERCAASPLDERLAGQLILALFRSGRQADALNHYHRIRLQLAEELGTEPGHPLQMLYQQILTDDPALLMPGTEPTLKSVTPSCPATPRQLPADVPRFVARRDQLKRLDTLLDESQDTASGNAALAAVCGPPGVGKTALQYFREGILGEFGAWPARMYQKQCSAGPRLRLGRCLSVLGPARDARRPRPSPSRHPGGACAAGRWSAGQDTYLVLTCRPPAGIPSGRLGDGMETDPLDHRPAAACERAPSIPEPGPPEALSFLRLRG